MLQGFHFIADLKNVPILPIPILYLDHFKNPYFKSHYRSLPHLKSNPYSNPNSISHLPLEFKEGGTLFLDYVIEIGS